MTLTHEIYDDLSRTIKNTNHSSLSKIYTTEKNLSLIYAVTQSDEKEKFYFSIGQNNIDFMPQCQGIVISRVKLYEYSKTDYFCELSPKNITDGDMFEVIIEDIRKNADNVSVSSQMITCVSNILLKWRNFFAQEKSVLLSIERQQGLYGELLLLRKFIQWYGHVSVSFWTGADYETHDYYIRSNAIEVKTTSTKTPYKMHISSEYQLDDKEIAGNLYVAFYALRKSTADGETLPDVIQSIRLELRDNSFLRNKFDLNLQKYGYFDGLENKYSTGYHIREEVFYQIKEGFPRIIKDNLSGGISRCTYDILTESCNKFKIDEEELKSTLREGAHIVR